ncbi:MAG: DUF2933 domain-containing protein [Euzebyales bacterium]|nr:DUF2933 domain-containing protein [Euzebyales bacterium]
MSVTDADEPYMRIDQLPPRFHGILHRIVIDVPARSARLPRSRSDMRMCLNKKVLLGLGAAAVGVLLLAPQWLGAALPLLLLAACPLSMVFMMMAMRGGGRRAVPTQREGSHETVAELEARLERARPAGRRARRTSSCGHGSDPGEWSSDATQFDSVEADKERMTR